MATNARVRPSVGIVGAGAIGTLFAISLAEAGADVRVLVRDRSRAHEIIARGGFAFAGGSAALAARKHSANPRATADPDALREVDIVLVAVKTYATQSSLEPLRGALHEMVPFVSLQNGIDAAERIDKALGAGHPIAHAVTTEAATQVVAGHARHTAGGMTVLGWAAARCSKDETLEMLAEILCAAGLASEFSPHIEPHLWGKLVINAAVNPVTALAGVCNGALLDEPTLHGRAAKLAREAATVAAACGIDLPFADPTAAFEGVARATAANRSSMLQDLEAGRPTEIEAINGALLRHARVRGIAVPENARIVDEVRARTKA